MDISVQKIGIRSGLLITSGLIVYFLLMKYFGFIQYVELRAFNFIILLTGLIFTYRYCRSKTEDNIDYFSGLLLGFLVTVVSIVPFALFVYIYFSNIDPLLLAEIKRNSPLIGENLNPVTASAAVIVEGISSGAIMSFSLMQYFKSGYIKYIKYIKTENKEHELT